MGDPTSQPGIDPTPAAQALYDAVKAEEPCTCQPGRECQRCEFLRRFGAAEGISP